MSEAVGGNTLGAVAVNLYTGGSGLIVVSLLTVAMSELQRPLPAATRLCTQQSTIDGGPRQLAARHQTRTVFKLNLSIHQTKEPGREMAGGSLH